MTRQARIGSRRASLKLLLPAAAAGSIVFATMLAAGCAGHHLSPPKVQSTPTPTGSATPTPTPTASATASPTPTPTGSATPVGSGSPTPAPTPSANPLTLASQLQTLNRNNNAISNVVLRGTDDAWVVTYDSDQWAGSSLPVNCAGELARLTSAGLTIGPVALGGKGDWVVVNSANKFRAFNIPGDLLTVLTNATTNSTQTISVIAIGPDDSYVVVLNGTDYRTAGVPGSLTTYLQSAVASSQTITRVALGTSGSWVVVTQPAQASAQNSAVSSSGISDAFSADLNSIQAKNTITGVALGKAGSYAVTYGSNSYYVNATRAARAASVRR